MSSLLEKTSSPFLDAIKAKKIKRQNPEDKLQMAVIEYIRMAYPKAIIVSTYHNGARQTSRRVRQKAKQMGVVGGIPDLLIFHSGKFLALELKAEGTAIWKKNGDLVLNKHIQEQYAKIQGFRKNGFTAAFAVGFEQAKREIDKWIG